MKRRNFLKVMGAGAGVTVFVVRSLGHNLIDVLAAPQTAAPTADQLIADAGSTVPAPPGGLGSNSNYFLYSDCNPTTGLAVTVEVTKDIIADIGFSIQLNAYSPPGANSRWQQYGITFDTTNGSPLKITGWVDNWASESFKQSQNMSAHSDLINHWQPMLTLPSATLPAGSKFTVSLEYDKDQNINGAKYLFVDNKGKSTSTEILLESLNINHSNPAKRITTTALAPINAFVLNVVGPANGKSTYFSTGAGTITYTASSPLTVLTKEPACCETQGGGTKEIANTVYGLLSAGPSQSITQSFDIDISHPYAPGKPFAVSQQFGQPQTALFAFDITGQLTVFTVQGGGHWRSSKPKGPPEVARPGAAVAASQRFGIADQTDVFLIDQQGQVNVYSIKGTAAWSGPQPIGPKNLANTGAALAASQHFGTPNQTDVFLVDSNGQLNMFWVVGSGDWKGPQTIGPNGFARSGADLAVSQHFGTPNQTDLFLVDTNGQLNVFSQDGPANWKGPQTIGPANFAPSGANLAVSQHFGMPNQTDVFVVDNKGQLNVFSVVGSGDWTGPQPIGAKGFARSGAALAVSQDFGTPNQTDVFVVDKNGQVNVFSAVGSGDWTGPQPIGPTGFAPSGAVVVASQQFGVPNQTDLFVISQAGDSGKAWPMVFSSGGSGVWNGPKALGTES